MIEKSPELQAQENIQRMLEQQESLKEELKSIKNCIDRPDKKYVYGIQGLCDLFCCSRSTAQRIKNSGKIDAAVAQHGRTIIVDAELAVSLLRESSSWNYLAKKRRS